MDQGHFYQWMYCHPCCEILSMSLSLFHVMHFISMLSMPLKLWFSIRKFIIIHVLDIKFHETYVHLLEMVYPTNPLKKRILWSIPFMNIVSCICHIVDVYLNSFCFIWMLSKFIFWQLFFLLLSQFFFSSFYHST